MQDHTVHVQCSGCPIRHRAVCARCETDELLRLEQIKYYRSFQAGQPVIWSGDRMEFVGSVVTGIATLTQTMEDGRRQMVGLLLPSDFVGRPGRATAAYDVTATTDLVMCCFRKKPFEEMMATTPHIAQRLLEMTLDELDAAREWMLLLGRKTAEEKVASFLLMLARRSLVIGCSHSKASGVPSFELPLTRADMADFLGLTIETVSRQITKLKTSKAVRLVANRLIQVPDIRRLAKIAGQEEFSL